jgi:FlaA1/EpsC-like NDP-sugar epimerase
MRPFNIYGENETFSFISRLIDAYKKKKTINIFNHGESVRDFVHINDVSKIYKKLLTKKYQGTYDIGTGRGIKIIDLIKVFKKRGLKIKFIKNDITEINNSIAKLNINLENFKFLKLENYLKKKTNISFNQLQIQSIYNENDIIKAINGYAIYGAGIAGVQIAKSIINNKGEIAFFIDDDKQKIKKKIFGKNIISFNQLKKISENQNIPNILIAIPSLVDKDKVNLIKKLSSLCQNILFLPQKRELKKNSVNFLDIRNIKLDDFLERKQESFKIKFTQDLKNSSILITGGAGSIGSELCKQIYKLNPKKIIVLDNSELALYKISKLFKKHTNISFRLGSILETNFIKKIIYKNKINLIFHTAAFKHVNILEKNIQKGVENNIFGTISLINACDNKKINIVFISTDKAVKAKSVLGFTKRIAEIYCQNYNQIQNNVKINVVRFGNVFASQGSAVLNFIDQINSGSEISITNKNVKRFFMSIEEACKLVIQASQLKNKINKPFILKMGNPIKIYEIIKKLISISKRKINIKEIGLKKGEKLIEDLSFNNKFFPTQIQSIQQTTDPKYKIKATFELIDLLKSNITKEKVLLKNMRKFLKKEIVK